MIRVLLVTQEEPFYAPVYISNILKLHKDLICGIICLPSFPSYKKMILYNFKFLGLVLFFYVGVRFVLFKLLNLLSYLLPLKRSYSISKLAESNKIPYHFLNNINANSTLEIIHSYKPDIILSIAAPQIFKEKILRYPKYGCFNIHSSMLPKYRGVNALFWALCNNEKNTGVTLHKMNESFDAGPIIIQKEFPIQKNDSLNDLYYKAIDVGSSIINEFLTLASTNGRDIPQREMPNKGSEEYYSFPQTKNRKLFHKNGKHFFRYY